MPSPPEPDAMLPFMAAELLRVRDEAEVSLGTLAEMTGVHKSTLSRFERGRQEGETRVHYWPENFDTIVAGYARAGGMAPIELWAMALRRWAQASNQAEARALAKRLSAF